MPDLPSPAPPARPTPRDASYIPTLDGWRAVAVLGVIAFHLRGEAYVHLPGDFLAAILQTGRLGVDLFFAISGFLITSRLVDELGATGRVSLRRFYARRAFRILPPALLFLALIGAMAALRTWRPTRIEWISSLLFFRNYADGHSLTEHLWSLSVEEHFYATWPLLFLFCARGRRAWLVPAVAVAFAIWRVLVVHGIVKLDVPGILYFRTDLRFDSLLWGAALALARRSERGRGRVRRWLSWPVVWLAAGIFVRCASIDALDVQATLVALSATALIAGTASHPEWRISRALEWRALRWVGRLSYSLYLFQQAFIAAPIDVPHPYWLCFPAACASYYLVERPLIRVGRDLLAGRWRASPARVYIGAGIALVAFCVVAELGWPHSTAIHGARVALYADFDYCGTRRTFGVGRYDLTRTDGIGNDVVSSLSVGDGARVRLCDDVVDGIPGGACVDYAPGVAVENVGTFNDRASFLVVEATTPP